MEQAVLNAAGLFALIVILVKDVIVPLVRKVTGEDTREKKVERLGYVTNPHRVGDSPMCRENRDKIISLETKVDNLTEDVRDIRRKMNGMLKG